MLAMSAIARPLPATRLLPSLKWLAAEALRIIAPPAAPKERTEVARALDEHLRRIEKTRDEAIRVTAGIRRDLIDFEWNDALTLSERAELLRFANYLEESANDIVRGTLTEIGPIWEIAKSVMAPYNDALRDFVRTAREAASTIRRVVAAEELDDHDAIAAFDSVDPEDPIVEPMLHS